LRTKKPGGNPTSGEPRSCGWQVEGDVLRQKCNNNQPYGVQLRDRPWNFFPASEQQSCRKAEQDRQEKDQCLMRPKPATTIGSTSAEDEQNQSQHCKGYLDMLSVDL
jgi:hypothetical protein